MVFVRKAWVLVVSTKNEFQGVILPEVHLILIFHSPSLGFTAVPLPFHQASGALPYKCPYLYRPYNLRTAVQPRIRP